ncbi:MAG: glycogen phosphorylase, partial [Nitrospiraceae bacterium]
MDQDGLNELLKQYGCGPIQFTGTNDALYERHLVFDHVIDPKKADQREQFEAAARSVRDVISQRWLQTERTYEQQNPKRVYYLSLEFLLGRSLANNVTNALLPSFAFEAMRKRGVDPLALLE